jgi:hypothetical protein
MGNAMNRVMLALTTAVALTLGAFGASADAHAATPVAHASQQKVAVIKIVVQEQDGTVVRAPIKAVRWGDVASFELTSDAHRHTIELRPARGNGSLAVDVSYTRDGSKVASQRSVAVGARSSVIHKDNGAKIMVTVIPTKVTVDTHQ